MIRLALAAVLFAAPAFADPALGTWQTAKDDNGNYGHIEVEQCGTALCGTLTKAFDGSGKQIPSDNIGRLIVWDMKALGGGKYGKGKVYSPDRDKTYNSRMLLVGDVLAVKGCVLGICRDGGRWQRVK